MSKIKIEDDFTSWGFELYRMDADNPIDIWGKSKDGETNWGTTVSVEQVDQLIVWLLAFRVEYEKYKGSQS